MNPPTSTPLSPAGRAQLLSVACSRRSAEIAVLVIPALLAALYYRTDESLALVPWALLMILLAAWMYRFRSRFIRDARTLSAASLLDQWVKKVALSAAFVGMLWVSPVVLVPGHPSFAFAIVFYTVLQGVSAPAAVYLSAVPGIFYAFLAGVWGLALPAIVWMFPNLWPILLPLYVLFCVVIVGHGRSLHRFMVRQIQLEEHSQWLADQAHAALNQAEQALHQRDLFLSTASHDLRQPAHAMTMLVEAVSLRNHDAALTTLAGRSPPRHGLHEPHVQCLARPVPA